MQTFSSGAGGNLSPPANRSVGDDYCLGDQKKPRRHRPPISLGF